ncbi:GDSL-type esterase/lipase family protein [Sphingomonas sp. IW22]|uniref:GDSL-type esterase/lipase family protein n=1 Tax=Sphingomonas sp. IW22 TaxID=3242489 RepID=UPI003521C4D4
MSDEAGLILSDTTDAQQFVGTDATDTVSFADAGRGAIADLSLGTAYKSLRILPFGDSITYGVIGSTTDTESGGYRTYLQEMLSAFGVTVDMVGSASNGPDNIDRDHEGRRGWTLNQLNGIDEQVIVDHAPDAVLLMAGTNDSARDSSTTMIADLRALIVSMTDQDPDLVLFVASIPPVRVGQQSQLRADRVDAYNDKMPDLIAELAAAGRNVHFVDMRGLDVADVSAPPIDSGLHPNAQGYAEIAEYWTAALEANLGLTNGAIGTDQDRFEGIKNLIGSAFDDVLAGDAGDNMLTGGMGDDRIDGREGIDTVVFEGQWRDYQIEADGESYRLIDMRGAAATDGSDHVTTVERFTFANGTFDAETILNDTPLATDDAATASVDGDMVVTGEVLFNDSDADIALGDTIQLTGAHAGTPDSATLQMIDAMLTLEGAYGTLTIMADGTFSYTIDPSREATQSLMPGDDGIDRFTYAVSDVAGAQDIGGIAITVTGGTAWAVPGSILYTRPATSDGSAAADQILTGQDGPNSFYFDIAARTGTDRIEGFEGDDIVLTSAPLRDGNGDGLIVLGRNGLALDGGSGSDIVVIAGLQPDGLRHLGERDGLSVYAAASVRPDRAIEGTLGDDSLAGDAGDSISQTFFMDSALDIALGNDQIAAFGARDIVVLTTALPDGNRDRIIDFGSDRVLNLDSGNLSLASVTGAAHQRVEFDGSVAHDGVTYFVYSLVGSAAGVADLAL